VLRPYGVVTLVTLPRVTDAATMLKISFWRYSAVNRQTLFSALACALLVFSMGCGSTNNLQSIQLSVSNTDANAGTGVVVFIDQDYPLYTWGNYSSGKQKVLSNESVQYHIAYPPLGFASTGTLGDPTATPPQTVQLSANGTLSAVVPYVACTFENVAVAPATTPAFESTGSYAVTATYLGLTTPPAYVGVATAAGVVSATNPTGECYAPPTGK
jgi:hypothetical protein